MKTVSGRDRNGHGHVQEWGPGHARARARASGRGVGVGSGFTLIELLTVIGVIGILAALVVGLGPAAKNARTNTRAKAELQGLQTAIEAYRADRNAFPPDNRRATGSPSRINPAVSPLYYELRGMEVVDNAFRCKGMTDQLTPEQVYQAFGRRGFLNASVDPAEPPRTFFDPKASGVRVVPVNGVNIELLVSPFDWPAAAGEGPIPGSRVNPWRYVSTQPTNNVGQYDLWLEVMVGKEKRMFQNW